MKTRPAIPLTLLPVITALLGLSQTILGQTALGRFIMARLREKLTRLLMDHISDLFREMVEQLGQAARTGSGPLAPAPAPTSPRPRQTSDPPERASPARRDPLRRPEVPAAQASIRQEADGPAQPPASTPEPPAPPAPAPAPAASRARPAAAAPLPPPNRARSPPAEKMARNERAPPHALIVPIW
jgi:hypothetical protein